MAESCASCRCPKPVAFSEQWSRCVRRLSHRRPSTRTRADSGRLPGSAKPVVDDPRRCNKRHPPLAVVAARNVGASSAPCGIVARQRSATRDCVSCAGWLRPSGARQCRRGRRGTARTGSFTVLRACAESLSERRRMRLVAVASTVPQRPPIHRACKACSGSRPCPRRGRQPLLPPMRGR